MRRDEAQHDLLPTIDLIRHLRDVAVNLVAQ